MNACFSIEELIPPSSVANILTGIFSASFSESIDNPEIVIVQNHTVSLYEISKAESVDFRFITEMEVYGSINNAAKLYWPSQNKNIVVLLIDNFKLATIAFDSSIREFQTISLQYLPQIPQGTYDRALICSDSIYNLCYLSKKNTLMWMRINRGNYPKVKIVKQMHDIKNIWLTPIEVSLEDCKFISVEYIVVAPYVAYIVGKTDHLTSSLSIFCYSIIQDAVVRQWSDDNLPIPIYDIKPFKDGVILLSDLLFVYMKGPQKCPGNVFSLKLNESISIFKDGACLCKYNDTGAIMLTSSGLAYSIK